MDTQSLAAADVVATASTASVPEAPVSSLLARLYPISLDVYHGMVKHGLLTKRDRIVLLDGLLVTKMTKGERHIAATYLLFDALRALNVPGWYVRKEDPIALPGGPSGRDSEPEPDLALVRGGIRDYVGRHCPGPSDVALVVEVADSSLRDDHAGETGLMH